MQKEQRQEQQSMYTHRAGRRREGGRWAGEEGTGGRAAGPRFRVWDGRVNGDVLALHCRSSDVGSDGRNAAGWLAGAGLICRCNCAGEEGPFYEGVGLRSSRPQKEGGDEAERGQ